MGKQEMRLRGLFLILLFMVMRNGRENWRGDLEGFLYGAIDHFKKREELLQQWEEIVRMRGLRKDGEILEGERQKEGWI